MKVTTVFPIVGDQMLDMEVVLNTNFCLYSSVPKQNFGHEWMNPRNFKNETIVEERRKQENEPWKELFSVIVHRKQLEKLAQKFRSKNFFIPTLSYSIYSPTPNTRI